MNNSASVPVISETDSQTRVSTGIPGLDEVLFGGLPSGHVYLIEGERCALAGAGEDTGLYSALRPRDALCVCRDRCLTRSLEYRRFYALYAFGGILRAP